MIHARRRAADVSIHVLPLPLSSLDPSLFLSATNAIAGARSAANKLLPSGFILSLPAIAPRFKSPKKGRVSFSVSVPARAVDSPMKAGR